jgi:hypothetical protein
MSSLLNRFGRSDALARVDRGEFLAKVALGLLLAGAVLQVVQQWVSVPGDILWILASVAGLAYTVIRATLVWASSGRIPWMSLPFLILYSYTGLVFAYWLLVDIDVIHGAGTQARLALIVPVLLLVGLYLWIKKRTR